MNRVTNKKVNKKNKKENRKENKKGFRFGRFLGWLILFAIVISGVVLGVKVHENGGGIQGIIATFLGHNEETLENLDTFYILAMGVSEDLEKKLTDTIILCAYNPKNQKASMLSIPRDTFVGTNKARARGSDKINSLYSESPEEIMEAVSELTGINVEYYAVINNEALIETVDIIGGVEFYVPMDMNYDDKTQDLHIHLKEGLQNINGEEAEQLLRFRHSNPDKNGVMTTYSSDYGSDDYGRMRTQRDFIIETLKQTLQIKNVTKIKSLITNVFNNLDTNLTIDMLLPYAPYAIEFDTNNIESHQLPGVSTKLNNLWFFVHDEEETIELVEKMNNTLNGIEPVLEDEDTNTIDDNNKVSNKTENTDKENISNKTRNSNTSKNN